MEGASARRVGPMSVLKPSQPNSILTETLVKLYKEIPDPNTKAALRHLIEDRAKRAMYDTENMKSNIA